jgi:ABC-type iron transport system FetAB ATPase subunit
MALSSGLISELDVQGLRRVVGNRAILTNLSFSLKKGETLFVRGPSGVGKSLLLRCLAFLDPIQVSNCACSAGLGADITCLKHLAIRTTQTGVCVCVCVCVCLCVCVVRKLKAPRPGCV